MTTVVLLLVFFVGAVSAASDNVTDTPSTTDVMNKQSDLLSVDTTGNVNQKINTKNIKSDSNTTSKITPNITVKNKTAKTNTSVVLEAAVPSDATGKAIFKINNLTIGEAFRVTGGTVKYNYKIPIYSAKDYTITFVYEGNSKYNSLRTDGILTLTKLNTSATIKLNKTTLAQGEKVRFDVNIKNELGSGIVDAFGIKFNGQSIGTNITDTSGVGKYYFTIPNTYKINNYTVQLVYGDTNTAIGKRINTTVTIDNPTKITLNNIPVTKTGSEITLTSKVTDKLNNNVTSGEVVYKINGLTMGSVNVTDGTAVFKYTLPLYAPKNYTITALYGGNRYYQPSSINKTLTIALSNTKITTNTSILTVGQANNLNVTVKDANNKAVQSGNLHLLINNNSVGTYAVSNGNAKISYTLKNVDSTKTVNAQLVFDANKYYDKSTLTLKVVNPTKVTLANIADVKNMGKITLNATVLDGLNKNVSAGKVEFKFDGKSVANVTVKNGQATTTYTLPLTSSGKHNVTATYIGNSYYQNSTQTTKQVNVLTLNTKITNNTNVNITAGGSNRTQIKVTDENNKAVQNGIVKLTVNNVDIANFTVSNGAANITFKSPNNQSNTVFDYKLQYVANSYYSASTASGKVNINPLSVAYVSTTGNNNNLGNINNPYKTISYALSHIKDDGIIIINPGEYKEANMKVNKSVNIYGSNTTKIIINANGNANIFNNTNSSANLTVINVTFKNTKVGVANSSAIVSKGPLILSKCTFTDNSATVTDASSSIYATGKLTLSQCNFTNNNAKSSGGAIKAVGQNVIILNSQFTNNTVNGNSIGGGAIYLNNANTTIETTTFTNNKVNGANVTGGAIRKVAGNLTLNHVTLNDNTISGSGYNVGGAIVNINGYMYVINSTLKNNEATSSNDAGGAAIYNQNTIVLIYNSTLSSNKVTGVDAFGGALLDYSAYISLTMANITNNVITATSGQAIGGAINQNNGTITVSNARFISNTAKGNSSYAGALYLSGSQLTINETQFTSNVANGTAAGGAGAIFVNAEASIEKTNFSSNKALGRSNGGGAIINSGNLTVTSTNFVSNVANATGSAISNSGKVVSAENNYWGSSSPNWNTLINGFTKPSKYSTNVI